MLPGDWETDPNNFDADHNVPKGVKVEPVHVKIFEGMRLFLTQNLNKRNDFVNGMTVTVEGYHDKSGCLQVLTKDRQDARSSLHQRESRRPSHRLLPNSRRVCLHHPEASGADS